jgi:hypothetical protein
MKSYIIPVFVALAALTLALYGYLYTPSAPQNTAPSAAAAPVAFTKLASGVQASVTTRTNYIVRTDADLRQLWTMIPDAGSLPTVDFSTNEVLALFAGQKPTAGYAIEATSITDGEKRVVAISLVSPDASCVLAQSLTSPYEIILVSKTTLALAHTDTASTTSCLPH